MNQLHRDEQESFVKGGKRTFLRIDSECAKSFAFELSDDFKVLPIDYLNSRIKRSS